MSKIQELNLTPDQALKLGRTLRRTSRTMQYLMDELGITEDSVKLPRKKRRKKTSTPVKGGMAVEAAE